MGTQVVDIGGGLGLMLGIVGITPALIPSEHFKIITGVHSWSTWYRIHDESVDFKILKLSDLKMIVRVI